jgi:hypothetical protein
MKIDAIEMLKINFFLFEAIFVAPGYNANNFSILLQRFLKGQLTFNHFNGSRFESPFRISK